MRTNFSKWKRSLTDVKRKGECAVMNLLTRRDKALALDMVEELIEANKQLRAENHYLRKNNVRLTEQNRKLTIENFELSHPTVKKSSEGTLPGWFFYAEMRNEGEEFARAFKNNSQ
jgi:hypothetical protein